MEFKAGDLVELKCGGPTMVIKAISTDKESALCEWFNQTGAVFEHKQHLFNLVTLKQRQSH